MGSPISGTMVEIFIQHLGDSFVKHLLDSKSITFYSRYVDDILKIYDSSYTNPNAKKQYANTIHNNLQINPSPENAGQISFLDLTFTRKTTSLEIDIFPKPTTNNTTINYLSSHPLEHKLAAYRYYIERMFSLSLNKENPLKEWTTILDIARSNNFPDNILIRLMQQIQQNIARTTPPTESKNNTKWTTFTNVSPQIRKITNIFRHTNVKIAFKCNNKISQLIKPNTDNYTPYYNTSGIYNPCLPQQQVRYLLIRSTYIIDPTYLITAFPNTINPLTQNMNLCTRILTHTLEYSTNKIPKYYTTLPPIMITLFSTTYHIRTT